MRDHVCTGRNAGSAPGLRVHQQKGQAIFRWRKQQDTGVFMCTMKNANELVQFTLIQQRLCIVPGGRGFGRPPVRS
eukprot:scaffold47755_cov23-Tisochrysis_lutea.AAC.1